MAKARVQNKTTKPNLTHRWLMEVTDLPTAAGREDAVIQWVQNWVARRKQVELKADEHGNLTLLMKHRPKKKVRPVYLTAHMDHPAFVVTHVEGKNVTAEFRGGVQDEYFVGSQVRFRDGATDHVGKVKELIAKEGQADKVARIRFAEALPVKVGDVLTWEVGPPRIEKGLLHTLACDDLAALVAALAAFDRLQKVKQPDFDVRVLLTRAEEVGFVGCIGACRSGTVPKRARVVALENSKSFAESPIGGGPIIRVGDRWSTFHPELTLDVALIAEQLASRHTEFNWQRKLMPGGVCEATAFCEFGYEATCICLPLGNYHNMADRKPGQKKGRIAAECISLNDFDHMVTWLEACGKELGKMSESQFMRERLDQRWELRKGLIQ